MKTNRDRAIELADNKVESYQGGVYSDFAIPCEYIEDIIKLASKPDWYYPSKGEFPEDQGKYLVLIDIYSEPTHLILEFDDLFNEHSREYWDTNVIAWTYLPKFEEDER